MSFIKIYLTLGIIFFSYYFWDLTGAFKDNLAGLACLIVMLIGFYLIEEFPE